MKRTFARLIGRTVSDVFAEHLTARLPTPLGPNGEKLWSSVSSRANGSSGETSCGDTGFP
jgi:hypothetical protein